MLELKLPYVIKRNNFVYSHTISFKKKYSKGLPYRSQQAKRHKTFLHIIFTQLLQGHAISPLLQRNT